jgi:hypothetical protein
MPNATCPTCGQPMQGGDCPRCRAITAFAKPEDAEQAKVTPPAASGPMIGPEKPIDDPTIPSIERKPLIVLRLPDILLIGILVWLISSSFLFVLGYVALYLLDIKR